jgi:hypothetical protein
MVLRGRPPLILPGREPAPAILSRRCRRRLARELGELAPELFATTVTPIGAATPNASNSAADQLTTTVSVPAGHTIVVAVATGTTFSAWPSVTDSAGNAYSVYNGIYNYSCAAILYCLNPAAGLASGGWVKVTWPSNCQGLIMAWCLNGKAALAGSNAATGASTNPSVSMSGVALKSAVFGVMNSGGSGTNPTAAGGIWSNDYADLVGGHPETMDHGVSSGSVTYSASIAYNNYAIACAAFYVKPASGMFMVM